MAEIDTSIYKNVAPPSNPFQMLDTASAANRLMLSTQELNARRAIGDAYQNAIDPNTGRIDTNLLMQGIKRSPDAGFLAGEASAGALSREGQTIANTTAATDLNIKRTQFVRDMFGSLANKPDLSKRDLVDAMVTASRNGVLPNDYVVNAINGIPNDPKGLRQWAQSQQALRLGAEGTAARVQGPPIPAGPQAGAQRTIPLGGAIYGDQGPGVSGAVTTTMPAGFGEAQSAVGGASGQASVGLRSAADSSPVRKGMLGNLEEDLQNFTAGPGADWTKVAKSWVNRNVPLPQGWQFDPKSIASQENFNKQATMLAQQQFSTIGGTGTDAKFASAFETNPNETLSQLGNQEIIRMLKGNEDAIQAKNKAWLQWRKQYGPQSYDEFSDEFNSRFDPRAFQFKYRTKKQRQEYIDHMDPRDRDKFLANLAAAHKSGWVTFPEQ